MDPLNSEEYGAWRHHPTTEKVRQYWRDYRARLMARWASGEIMTDAQQAYAQVLGDMDEMSFEDIETFYKIETEEEDDDSEEEGV